MKVGVLIIGKGGLKILSYEENMYGEGNIGNVLKKKGLLCENIYCTSKKKNELNPSYWRNSHCFIWRDYYFICTSISCKLVKVLIVYTNVI